MNIRGFFVFLTFISLINSNIVFGKEIFKILAFSGYADKDWVLQFEKLTNTKVEVTIIDTDDQLFEKISQNHGQYFDVFSANTAELQRYIDVGIASPINIKNIPNIKNQLPRFQHVEKISGIMRNSNVYAIPYTYSEMGLIYDRKQFKTPPITMAEMWNPKFRGKILIYDGSVHNFSFTALLLGIQNPFKLSEANFYNVIKKLDDLRENEPRFYISPDEGSKKFIDNNLALMFGNFGQQQVKKLQADGANVGYVIPKEGALAWLDCWIITSLTKNRELAEKWINFSLSKKISSELNKRQNLANTLMKTKIKNNDKIVWLEPVENNEKRVKNWKRIRNDKARLQQN